MSVLDYSVSRDGYLVSDHASELTEAALQETIDAVGNSFEGDIQWRNKIRAIADEVYRILHNTDMRPEDISSFEILNSTIVNLANKIADCTAKENVSWSVLHRVTRKSTNETLEPYLLKLMANKKRISTLLVKSGQSFESVSPLVFVDTYRIPDMIAAIQSIVCSGLSNRIIDIPQLMEARDEYTLEHLSEYQSFEEILNMILSSDVLYASMFVPEYDCNRFIDDIRRNNRCEIKFEDGLDDRDCVYAPYKAIARAALDNLDEIYDAQGIPETAYNRLASMAFTLVNLFNVYWITSYIEYVSFVDKIKQRKYADMSVATLKTFIKPEGMSAEIPQDQPDEPE